MNSSQDIPKQEHHRLWVRFGGGLGAQRKDLGDQRVTLHCRIETVGRAHLEHANTLGSRTQQKSSTRESTGVMTMSPFSGIRTTALAANKAFAGSCH